MANILVVDDEKSVRTLLGEIVRRMDHTPIEAGNGKEAYEKYRQTDIDLSIVDINMPEMNGITFLEEVKKVDPHAVVVIMTGYPSAETIIQMIEDDGYTYVTKPIDVERIMDLVSRGLQFRKKMISETAKKES